MTSADIERAHQDGHLLFPGGRAHKIARFQVLRGGPPLDEAMQTTPAIDRATRRYWGPTQPSTTKIRQVSSRVAIVMPEIGLEGEPMT